MILTGLVLLLVFAVDVLAVTSFMSFVDMCIAGLPYTLACIVHSVCIIAAGVFGMAFPVLFAKVADSICDFSDMVYRVLKARSFTVKW